MSAPKCDRHCSLSALDDPAFRHPDGYLLGRNELPAALWDEYSAGDRPMSRHRLRLLIADAWTMAEFPARALEPDDWSEMFLTAGFVTDCNYTRRPRRTRKLWRGCPADGQRGMSWTNDIEIAQRFATIRRGGVVAALVPESAVLARFVHGRAEAEWVLDPEWLEFDADIVQMS